MSGLSHPLSRWRADDRQFQEGESFLEAWSLENWRSGEKETWQVASKPEGVSNDLSLGNLRFPVFWSQRPGP